MAQTFQQLLLAIPKRTGHELSGSIHLPATIMPATHTVPWTPMAKVRLMVGGLAITPQTLNSAGSPPWWHIPVHSSPSWPWTWNTSTSSHMLEVGLCQVLGCRVLMSRSPVVGFWVWVLGSRIFWYGSKSWDFWSVCLGVCVDLGVLLGWSLRGVGSDPQSRDQGCVRGHIYLSLLYLPALQTVRQS